MKKNKRAKVYGFGLLAVIYDLLFIGSFLIYLPVCFLRKKITIFSLLRKIGFFLPSCNKSIWIHAVSLGEVSLIEPIVNKMSENLKYSIVISTTTLTGNRVAYKKYGAVAKIIYFPLDISAVIKKFLRKINPKIFITAEGELWPNLISHIRRKKIPFLIINGRISERAFRRYRLIRPVMKKMLSGCSRIGVQNEQYRKRFIDLGAEPERVSVTGSLKFNSINPDEEKIQQFKQKYTVILKPNSRKLFIAASTHKPEEENILDFYKDLHSKKRPTLLIAPRHPERVTSIEKIALAKGFKPVRISEVNNFEDKKNNLFILDTVGQLSYFYNICDICFVGGSLSGSGGHNILEPLYFSKPVLFGPSMENFSDIAKKVIDNSAGIQVNSFQELKEKVKILLENEKERNKYSQAAKIVFEKADSLSQNLKMISKEFSFFDES
ncbi:MAG: glycosyltransferase [Candidatus Omnitrophica bacterium]|nr:glycosyltransferase [Candidatus Omnitrophota bacterium]MCF7877187.1 glycosyltransferase [Candidatus Omnitrophota bacterium]MCF7877994.1 glycosyltransferase [Candidatus Omnitrophota bacterium]MCF7892914.1 glycosyltransferase [Candidatus Omnitrophota bacterium]